MKTTSTAGGFHYTKIDNLLPKIVDFFGAGNQNRTDDLVITNDVLYRLSHTSDAVSYDSIIIS